MHSHAGTLSTVLSPPILHLRSELQTKLEAADINGRKPKWHQQRLNTDPRKVCDSLIQACVGVLTHAPNMPAPKNEKKTTPRKNGDFEATRRAAPGFNFREAGER